VGGGRFARVFVGVVPGWFAGKGEAPSIEELRDHMSEVMNTDEYIIPKGAADEMGMVYNLLKD
jgi:hypothetical protein